MIVVIVLQKFVIVVIEFRVQQKFVIAVIDLSSASKSFLFEKFESTRTSKEMILTNFQTQSITSTNVYCTLTSTTFLSNQVRRT